MFEWLKERLHIGRGLELEELRSHVSKPSFEPISHEVKERFNPTKPIERYEERYNVEPFEIPKPKPIPEPRREDVNPTFETFPNEELPSIQPAREERSLGKIEDEIKFIKEQLSAIKAIVETINEKVKNIQRDVERRY